MNSPAPTAPARRTPLVLAALTLIAVVAFAGVSRLVTRLKANEKRIAFHAYEAGLAQFQAGQPEAALDDFRAALSYDRDNPEYQLNLARALRDTGRLDESESYLNHLWESSPQDATINLALARLAVRRHSIDDALRYYHNAIYGIWPRDPELKRRQARLELIDFLLQQKANAQAQAELMALRQTLPSDPQLHLAVADRFRQAQDFTNALTEYEAVLKMGHQNSGAAAGAGEAAFQLGRYRTAQKYLQAAVDLAPNDPQLRQHLDLAGLVLATDPFLRRLPDAERNRRLALAFGYAGDRIKSCAEATDIDLSANPSVGAQSGNDLRALWANWHAARPDLQRLHSSANGDVPDALMDLILHIEQGTEQQCGPPTGADLALLLVSRNREAVDE